MAAFLTRRLAIAALTLIGVSVIAFVLMRAIPGDHIVDQMGMHYTQEEYDRLVAEHGLDEPVWMQYGRWFGNAVRGDLGESMWARQPVVTTVAQHLPVTVQLAVMALGLALVLGIPLGVLAAVHQGRAWDYVIGSVGVLGVSVPNFWLGTLLILLFSYELGWFPSAAPRVPPLWAEPLENLRYMILPAIALGTAVAAVVVRMTRSSMLEVLGEDYIRAARAKGVSSARLMSRHALRNALIPVMTIAGVQAGYLLGGSIVIEMVFTLPGIGWLAYEAATGRDYMLLQAVILLIATGFVLVNLVVDVLYGVVDPRMRK